MKLNQLDVVQFPEKDLTDEIQEAVMKAINEAGTVNIPWHVWVRMWLTEKLHFLGLHQWANLRVFDPSTNRMLHTGEWACLICTKVRR